VVSKARLETLTDGVFAIAITILALTIAQPSDYRRLAHQLGERWPSLAAYAVSFAIIGIMWLNHHAIFSHLERIDRPFFYLNLVLLMTIVFIPYSTSVLGEALSRGEGAGTAAVLYSATMAVNGYTWAALWLYASRGRRLLQPSFPEEQRRRRTLLFIAGTVPYTVSIAVALVNPYVCLAFHGVVAVYYACDPISRRDTPVSKPLSDQ
jgi:TMEM175 potassium channel family protein